MKKTVIETLEVFALATAINLIICIVTGAGLWGTIYALWDIVTWIGIVLLLDDFFFKLNRYRRLLIWEYFVGFSFAIMAIVGFSVARYANTCLFTYGGLGLCVAFVSCFILWDLKVYNIATLSEDELKVLEFKCWFRQNKKKPAEDMKNSLYTFLRFRCKDNILESGIDISNLLDPDSASTVKELVDGGIASQVLIDEMRNYINNLVDVYTKKRDK